MDGAQSWLDLLQTVGIVGGLLFAAYTAWKDERARRVGNSIAIAEQYRKIWKELYDHTELSRVLAKDADVGKQAISIQEELFVKTLVLHLGTVFQAMKHREFTKLEGLRKDVREFFALPIPREVWQRVKTFQDRDFVDFIGECQPMA